MPINLGRWTHAVLRIGAGALFIEHGLQKLFGMLGGFGAPGGTAALQSQMGLAGMMELVGGGLLMIGLLTRPVAAILVLEMIAAYFIAHAPQGPWPIQNQGELALLYASVFVFLAGNGAGPLSIDAMLPGWRMKRTTMPGERRHGIIDRRNRPHTWVPMVDRP